MDSAIECLNNHGLVFRQKLCHTGNYNIIIRVQTENLELQMHFEFAYFYFFLIHLELK